MKYAIIITLLFAACTNADFKHSPNDTTQTATLFLLPNGVVNAATAIRIAKDSLALDTSDKNRPNLKWMRDTIYYVPMEFPLFDSLKHPILHSITHQQKTQVALIQTDKKNILQDFNKTLKQ